MGIRQCLPECPFRTVAIVVALVFATACEPPQVPIDETSTSRSENPVSFAIDLPEGWNDLIDEYRREVPNTVLSAVWSPASELNTGEPFATVSVEMYGPSNRPRREVLEDLDSWEQHFEDAVRGESGGLETLAGGAGCWGSISGVMDDRETTIYSVHLYHGPYELMVLIETYDQEGTRAREILDALETVEFAGPQEISGRAGRPLDEDGRWHSYCRTMSIPSQKSWNYEFEPSYDREPWDCPVDVDYLGAWATDLGDSEHIVSVYHYRNETVAEVHNLLSLPDVVGDSVVSPAGFTHTLVSQELFTLADGTTGVWSQDRMESPSGEFDYLQLFGFDTPAGGSVLVGLMNSDDGFVEDIDVIFAVLEALVVVDVS